jgi:hypothetical protein
MPPARWDADCFLIRLDSVALSPVRQAGVMTNRSSVGSGAPPGLERRWWFPSLSGLREGGSATYLPWDLDDQPPVINYSDGFDWLEREPEKSEWTIDKADPGAQSRALSSAELRTIPVAGKLPTSLLAFAQRTELQRRIRSATAAYLDLGDFAAPTSVEGSVLLHLLSDQQWCRHWLLYLDSAGGESVLTSTAPIGFRLPADWADEPGAPELPPVVIPLDGTVDLDVCADSFAEFLFRFWVENEIFFELQGRAQLTGQVAAYAAQLGAGA